MPKCYSEPAFAGVHVDHRIQSPMCACVESQVRLFHSQAGGGSPAVVFAGEGDR